MSNIDRSIEYTLYKEPISLETLHIVQYLHANGIKLLPKYIIERNHGTNILPTIVYGSNVYSGLSNVIKFYENISNIDNLLIKSSEWKLNNSDYRINQ